MDGGLTAGYRRQGWGNGRVAVVPAAAVDGSVAQRRRVKHPVLRPRM